ncbi:CRISPR-associated endonuclease Cas2 [Halorutilales archaeon Cl-col2-1]
MKMNVIIVYDVKASRTQKLCDYLRKWLTWRQNSVFDGELTQSEYKEIKSGLDGLVQGDDQVIVYKVSNPDWVETETIGESLEDNRFL